MPPMDLQTKTLLDKLFLFLTQRGIKFCVLGITSTYPTVYEGDIDLAVQPVVLEKMPTLLWEFCQETGTKFIQALQHEKTSFAYYLVSFDESGSEFLIVDICSDYYRNGQRLLVSDEIMTNCQLAHCNKFFIAEPSIEFIYYLLKKTGKKELNDTHAAHLKQLFFSDRAEIEHQISRYWTGAYQAQIIEAAQSNRWNLIRDNLSNFQKNMHPISNHKEDRWSAISRTWRRLQQPSGLFVVILGVDGSGKSTVINRIINTMSGGFRKTQTYHLRPRFGLKPSSSSPPVTNPHGQPPRSSFFSIAKVFYFWLDYTLSYFMYIYWLLARSTLLIFDRYYYDILIDPKRFRYSGPQKLLSLIGEYIPKPDLVILLDAPTAVLQSRKQEVSPEETERQRQEFLDLVQMLPNGYVINTAQPIEHVVRDVQEVMITYLQTRLKTRLGFQ